MTPVVGVVPFGAVAEGGDDENRRRAGAWARQIARRLVERLSGGPELEVRPVFLVAMPETGSKAGYLVLGSVPDPSLAAEYARSLGATHAVTGTYREAGDGRRLDVVLIDAAGARVTSAFEREVAVDELHHTEPALAAWLAAALDVRTERDLATPATSNEVAYAALLVGMDAEVDASLLRQSDPRGSSAALGRAAAAYTFAASADPTSVAVEERILVMAAAAIESEQQPLVLDALEALSEVRPRSWRVHYVLGEVRRTSGDVNGAIVAFEHSDALQPLRAADVLTLAQLYITAGAPAVAASRLRRVINGSAEPAVTATARRLRLGLRRPELERDLEEAGRIAVDADQGRAAHADAAFARVIDAEPDVWEAHFGRGLLARQRGDTVAAAEAFRHAVKLNPDARTLLDELEGPAERN